MKKLLTITMLLALTGCVTLIDQGGRTGSFSPEPLFLKNLPQDESRYSMGFRDGCYNFIGQNGYGMHRYYDKPHNNDPKILNSRLYQQGYRHGDRYCGIYINKNIIL